METSNHDNLRDSLSHTQGILSDATIAEVEKQIHRKLQGVINNIIAVTAAMEFEFCSKLLVG
jgi:hypothetical protein